MINDAPLARFAPLGEAGCVRPIYADYSFGNIPNTIEYLLTGEQARAAAAGRLLRRRPIRSPRRSCVIFVDSFGWQFWQALRQAASGQRAASSRSRHADADLGAVSVDHGRLGLDHEPRRAARRARALRVEHLHPGLRRGDPVAGLHAARPAPAGRLPWPRATIPASCSRCTRRCTSGWPARRPLDPVRAPQLRGLGLQHASPAPAPRSSATARWPRRWCSSRRRCSPPTARPARLLLGRHRHHRPHLRARHQLPRRRDRQLLAHLRRGLPRRRQPRHALSVHRRPRPRLCRRARHDLHQRALPGSSPTACP